MVKDALFFHDGLLEQGQEIQLAETTSKHILQVLRMQVGDMFRLTNGQGISAEVIIKTAEKKKCFVIVKDVTTHLAPQASIHLAVSFTKNTSRNEWILEKATELGVQHIIPIQSVRTERVRIKDERWLNIITSALLQSQQYFLPQLHEVTTYDDLLKHVNVDQKLIAHCINDLDRKPIHEIAVRGKETLILIGPEGDFTQEEVALATQAGFQSVSIANQRLRTETAAIAVCSYLNMINHA